MKLLTISLIAVACVAQTAAPEPEIADVFYHLDNGVLVPLERQEVRVKSNVRGFLVMSMKTGWEFPAAKSAVRFHRGEKLDLLVRSASPRSVQDPNTLYSLRKLSGKKTTRELVTMSGHASPFGFSSTTMPGGTLAVDFSKYGDSSFKMTTGALEPGEYAVGRPYGPVVFCFGVD